MVALSRGTPEKSLEDTKYEFRQGCLFADNFGFSKDRLQI